MRARSDFDGTPTMEDLLDTDRLHSLLSRMAELEKDVGEQIQRRSDAVTDVFDHPQAETI